jgi:hypothetical protein
VKICHFLFVIITFFLLACGNDNGLEDLKNKAKEYEGRIDSIGCVSLENYVKQDLRKSLNSLRIDSAFPAKLREFLKDSLGLGCDPMSLRLNNGPYNVNVFLKNSYSMDGYIKGRTKFKTETSALLNDLTSENTGTLYHFNKEPRLDSDSKDAKKLGESIRKLNYQIFSKKGLPNEGELDERISAREFSDIVSIMKTAISKTDSLSMSIVISDLNVVESDRIDLSKPGAYENIVSEASYGIRDLLKNKTDLSLFVLRLESEFYGYYYDIKGNCYIDTLISFKEILAEIEPLKQKIAYEKKELGKDRLFLNEIKEHGDNDSLEKKVQKKINYRIKSIASYEKEIAYLEKGCPKKTAVKELFLRPYFIWIFGTEPQLENVLKSSFFKEKKYDIAKYIRNNSIAKLEVLDCPKYKKNIKGNNCPENQSYDTLNLAFYQTFGDSIRIRKNYEKKLEIPIKLNFGGISRIASDILQNPKYYKLNDTVNFIIEKHQNVNEFVVKNKDNSKYDIYNIRDLSAKIEPKYDWINKYSCHDDLNFSDNYRKKQTPGLDSLLGKIHSLFYEHPLSSFHIKIGAK